MSVVEQHFVEALDGQLNPRARRVAKKLHALGYTVEKMRIGVISDTHGLLRPEALVAFRGVDHILHCGDIGGEHVLEGLRALAPLTACAGNVDDFRCGDAGPVARVSLGGLRFLLVHMRDCADDELRKQAADVVVFGHSHKPHDEKRDVWWFNPGSAGPRRFRLPVCVGFFEKERSQWRARHLMLQR